MKNDMFIDIAASGIGGRAELLHEPKPIRYKKKKCNLKKATTDPIDTQPKMSSQKELIKELDRMRALYKPFLADYAPKAKEYKKSNRNGQKFAIFIEDRRNTRFFEELFALLVNSNILIGKRQCDSCIIRALCPTVI